MRATTARKSDATEPAADGGLLTTDEAARYLAVSYRMLESFRLTGGGPRFVKIGRAVRYRRTDLDAFAESRLVGSTSDDEYRQ